ncbi:MAG: subclass B1 metallo-beta-lactamase [Bacteroidetes bacterium]|nr:MAG: subclass B1 metallo-beta-lactamase [Bacteroidota bacterium]
MHIFNKYFSIVVITTLLLNCNSTKHFAFEPKEVYKTNNLIINQISDNSFTHISNKQTNEFGNVPCNGLLVRNNNEAIVFDTPTNDTSARELIKWIKETLNCRINAVIPTHFHDDCLGGLKAFEENQIPSYSNYKTIELSRKNNFVVPENGFTDSLILKVGDKIVIAKYFGEGHTIDNVVGYFPSENIMFGGCLIKALKAGKGYLGDANVANWSMTVEKVKNEYPNVEIVVPGHGEYGDKKLLDYTINLFRRR